MYTTYHLQSAKEVGADILESIKTAFRNKAITITVEEDIDETDYLMSSAANRAMLDKSLAEAKRGELIEVKPKDLMQINMHYI